MTRGTFKTLLRRRLKDPDGLDFDDAILEAVYNEALIHVQKAQMTVDPDAFRRITRQNIEDDQDLYKKPDGTWSLVALRYYNATTASYQDMGDPVSLDELDRVQRAAVTAGTTTAAPRWGLFGAHIRLSPTPSTNVTNGLEWITVPSLAVNADAEAPDLHPALHNAVVLRAQILLSPENAADASLTELKSQLREELEGIPLFYRTLTGHTPGFRPALDKMGREGLSRG